MGNVHRYEIREISNSNEYELIIYMEEQLTEFSDELGSVPINKRDMTTIANKIVKEQYPTLKVKMAKVLIGGFVVASFSIIGQQVSVEAAELKTGSSASETNTNVYYHVLSGDTLWKLSVKFGISVDEIKKANKLVMDVLQVNQRLIIPKAIHTVTVGDYLTVLAKKYGTPVNAIKEANGMTSDSTRLGQTLIIPQLVDGQNSEPAVQNQSTEYRVVSGDSLSVIAKRFGTTVDALRSTNHLPSDIIKVGQLLTIPTTTQKVPTQAQPPSTTPQGQTKTTTNYTVVAGDSLSVIAKKNNVSVDQLKQANQLTTDLIRVGQLLTIPNGQVGTIVAPTSETGHSTSVELNEVQKNLKVLGYFAVPTTTGSGDQVTKQAVKSFQEDYGLPMTGIADEATKTALEHALVKKALLNDTSKYIGVPYKWGGTTPSGFDCSGFVYYMFKQQGVNMSRNTSAGLYKMGIPIERGQLQPGDLVFFAVNTTGTISHVGFYSGDNQFISATNSKGIAAYSIDHSYWGKYYVGAKRVY